MQMKEQTPTWIEKVKYRIRCWMYNIRVWFFGEPKTLPLPRVEIHFEDGSTVMIRGYVQNQTFEQDSIEKLIDPRNHNGCREYVASNPRIILEIGLICDDPSNEEFVSALASRHADTIENRSKRDQD